MASGPDGGAGVTREFNPFSDDFFDDPYDTYAWLRDERPVYFNEEFGFYALSRFDDVVRAHRDWQTFSSNYGVTLEQLRLGKPDVTGSIITIDPPEHERMRKLVSRAFTPRAVAAMEPLIREVQGSYLDRLMGRSDFDAVGEFAACFPCDVISTILGVAEPDRDAIRHRMDLMLLREPGNPNTTDAGRQAAIENGIYFYGLAREKRAHPDEHMISLLCEVEIEEPDGSRHRLTDAEIAGFATLLAGAGSETVTKLVANAFVEFYRHPDQWQLVLAGEVELANVVEEILRFLPPSQYQGRFSVADAEFEGGTIPAGHPVFLLTGAATRDPRAYDDPDRFDVSRAPQLAVGLGHGIHACLGAALARLESRIAIEEMARRWPKFEVDESGLERVHMSNVAGWSKVPVRVG
jgi:cytochrome P450